MGEGILTATGSGICSSKVYRFQPISIISIQTVFHHISSYFIIIMLGWQDRLNDWGHQLGSSPATEDRCLCVLNVLGQLSLEQGHDVETFTSDDDSCIIVDDHCGWPLLVIPGYILYVVLPGCGWPLWSSTVQRCTKYILASSAANANAFPPPWDRCKTTSSETGTTNGWGRWRVPNLLVMHEAMVCFWSVRLIDAQSDV